MSERSDNCCIAGAEHSWRALGRPGDVREFLDEVFALPPHERPEQRILRPEITEWTIQVCVRGNAYVLWGCKDSEGKWVRIHEVQVPFPT